MNRPPKVTGTAEVVLNVDDIRAMKSFYQEILGFELHSEFTMESEQAKTSDAPTICFLTIAEMPTPLGKHGHPQLLALIDYRRHVFATRFTGRTPSTSSLNHLAFEIPPEAFEGYLEFLNEAGIETMTTEFPAMNARAIFFQDPEENRLELITHHRNA